MRPGSLDRITKKENDRHLRQKPMNARDVFLIEYGVSRRDLAANTASACFEKRKILFVVPTTEVVAPAPSQQLPFTLLDGAAKVCATSAAKFAIMRSGAQQPLEQAISRQDVVRWIMQRAIEIMQFLYRWHPNLGMCPQSRPKPARASFLRTDAEKIKWRGEKKSRTIKDESSVR
jgi:hypothetical protein